MKNLKNQFIQFCIENSIIRFGQFELKSGRTSPYFFNSGLFNNGALLASLGKFYAQLIAERIDQDVMLYGPAYKGIPLVCAIAIQMAEQHNRNLYYAFNRKEAKDHGEGGSIVGAELKGDVVIVDDVITAGTSINESAAIIKSAGAVPRAIVIALDRQEVANGERQSAVQNVEDEHGITVFPLLRLDDLIGYLESSSEFQSHLQSVADYRNQYGIS